MNSSLEQREAPESHILRLLRRLRDGWGMILFTLLLTIYLTGFYHHSSSAEAQGRLPEVPEESQSKEARPVQTYLHVPPSTDYQEALPGSVKSSSSTFELSAAEKNERDANTLPGAIGLEGAFDEHGDELLPGVDKNGTKPTVKNSTASASAPNNSTDTKEPGKNAVDAKSEVTALTKESESKATVSTGEETSPVTKKNKKRKKKVRKSPSEPNSSDKSTAKSGKKKKRKRKKKKKKKKKKIGPGTAESSAPKSEEKVTNSTGVEEKTKPKEGTDGDVKPPGSEPPSLNTAARTENDTSEKGLSVISSAPRPMDRKMEELQVPGETGTLEEEAIKGYYGKLVKAYLAPFTNGINRAAFFNIMRRRTYSLSPPGSNKGVQTILFQLIKKKLFLMDPYEVMKNSKPFYKTRVNELIWLLSEIARGGNVPDTEFLVAIHDCVQTVNANHKYRGAVYMESNPTFTIVSCNFSDNIPIPMWEGDPVRGGLKSWDKKMDVYKSSDKTAWADKKEKAVFRGGNRPSMFFKNKADADTKCDDAGRSRLSYLGKTHADLFDVSVSGKWCGTSHQITPLSEADHHQFKYILYAEGNCFWADRLNKQVFGPSAVVKQETPCGQFWEPLLKPMTHYIPTDFFFQDTVDQLKWAKEHDQEVQKIVNNANEFAGNFLSEKGIKTYVEVLLNEYTKLLTEKNIEQEKGSKEVTAR